MTHTLPELPYSYDALEPHIDKETVTIHHDRHFKAYIDGLNNAESKLTEAREKGDFALVKHWERELAFHGSGVILHKIYFENMKPNGGGDVPKPLTERINHDFGSFEAFKKQFTAAAVQGEGSAWAILCWNPEFQKLVILTAEKHQNLTQWGVQLLMIVDVWEHAYYLKYQNNRAGYVEAWWNVVNWDYVNSRYTTAIK